MRPYEDREQPFNRFVLASILIHALLFLLFPAWLQEMLSGASLERGGVIHVINITPQQQPPRSAMAPRTPPAVVPPTESRPQPQSLPGPAERPQPQPEAAPAPEPAPRPEPQPEPAPVPEPQTPPVPIQAERAPEVQPQPTPREQPRVETPPAPQPQPAQPAPAERPPEPVVERPPVEPAPRPEPADVVTSSRGRLEVPVQPEVAPQPRPEPQPQVAPAPSAPPPTAAEPPVPRPTAAEPLPAPRAQGTSPVMPEPQAAPPVESPAPVRNRPHPTVASEAAAPMAENPVDRSPLEVEPAPVPVDGTAAEDTGPDEEAVPAVRGSAMVSFGGDLIYPKTAQDRGYTGTVVVEIVVDGSTGRAADIRLSQGSGQTVLDQAALLYLTHRAVFERADTDYVLHVEVTFRRSTDPGGQTTYQVDIAARDQVVFLR